MVAAESEDIPQEPVDDTLSFLAHETMPGFDVEELSLSIDAYLEDIETLLLAQPNPYACPPPSPVRIYHDPPSTTSRDERHPSASTRRRLRHMR